MASPLVTKPGLRRVDFPACTANACGQDSRRCKTPQACQVPEGEVPSSTSRLWFWIACAVSVFLWLWVEMASMGAK